jgi:hypothetical protein
MSQIRTRTINALITGLAFTMLESCTALDNPFQKSPITRTNVCQTDLTSQVELERSLFVPPKIWSSFQPCESVYTSRDLDEDAWGMSVALYYTYADVLVHDSALGFGVIGNLDIIGDLPTTLEGWKQREDKKWQKYMKKRGDSEKREVVYETRNGLECWRETTKSFLQGRQSALSVAYHCWEPGKTHYPPLSIGGWIRYWDGKPVYDLDIDKDLIDPVFATLEVKDIKPEVYAERMANHEEKVIKDCKWRLKDVKKNRNQAFNAYSIEKLESCGYDTSKLKREQE